MPGRGSRVHDIPDKAAKQYRDTRDFWQWTHAALSFSAVAGDVIRLISADGLTIKSYEVGSGSTTTTTVLRSPVNGFSSSAPTANQFAGGKMWVYAGNGATAGQKTTTGTAALAVTGDDIDGMGVIYVDAITNY
jgi:hypothetical protein